MGNIPGWAIRIHHLHDHRARICQLMEEHAWDKDALPGMDILTDFPDTDLAIPFDNEVSLLFRVVMPRNLAASRFKLNITLAEVWMLDHRCASNKVSRSATGGIAAARCFGNINNGHISIQLRLKG